MPKRELSPFEKQLEKINIDFWWMYDNITRKDSLNYYFTAKKNGTNIYECKLSVRTNNDDLNFKQLKRVNIYTFIFENSQDGALIFDVEFNNYTWLMMKQTQRILTNLFMCGMEVENINYYNNSDDEITFTVQVKDDSYPTIFNKYFTTTESASMKYTQYVLP